MDSKNAETSTPTSYTLCDTPEALRAAVEAIRRRRILAVDCEGKTLGNEGGALSLISIRAISSESADTFLIDAVKLDAASLAPIFDILHDESYTKVFFDGRMDFNELWHSYRVEISGAIDLQIADVVSRDTRGEDGDDRMRRLSPYLHRSTVRGNPLAYRTLDKLLSLDKCAREHDLGRYIKVLPVNHDAWMKRPLDKANLDYSAQDLYLISLLYTKFQEERYLSGDTLARRSARYISMWRGFPKPEVTNTYQHNALLPLGILEPVGTLSHECIHCKRRLPPSAFGKNAWRVAEKRHCWVCHAVAVRTKMHIVWEREELEREEYYATYDSDRGPGYDSD